MCWLDEANRLRYSHRGFLALTLVIQGTAEFAADGGAMRLRLMPKKPIFFVRFSEHADNSLKAARALEDLFKDFTDVDRKVRDIHALEHHGDELTHGIIKTLNETFVTPLDREDIVRLAT